MNRRDFLRRTVASSMLALLPRGVHAATKTATLYVTDATRKHAAQPLQWVKAVAAPGATIEIDRTRQYQAVLGFGAALTDASCFLLSGMPLTAPRALLADIYTPLGLNLNMGRCCIGASDYSRGLYSYDDVQAVEAVDLERMLGFDDRRAAELNALASLNDEDINLKDMPVI